MEKYEEAIQAYDEAINVDPEESEAWDLKGAALYNLGEYDAATNAITKQLRSVHLWKIQKTSHRMVLLTDSAKAEELVYTG